MPSVNFTYPGVYIEEIPSGIVTITGVATSITAFVGRTPMGPVGPDAEPIHCYSFADFERYFGGRTDGYPLTYAVEDFFQNGGSDAVVVRVYKAAPAANAPSGTNPPPAGNAQPAADGYATLSALNLRAYSPGAWANSLTASVDSTGISDQVAAQYKRYALAKGDLFNLTLTYTRPDGTTVVERYTNVTVKNASPPNCLYSVLKSQSQLATMTADPNTKAPNLPATPQSTYTTDSKGKTTDTPLTFGGGADSAQLGAEDVLGDPLERTGMYALDHVDLFNIMCIPWDQPGVDFDLTVYQQAAIYCHQRRAMLILDAPNTAPNDWIDKVRKGDDELDPSTLEINSSLLEARNCAVYFPRVKKINEEKGGIIEVFPACGAIAGIYAATDLQRGVWKAPAGITAGIGNIVGLEMNLTDGQNGALNVVGINCLRTFPIIGSIVWGARTLRGADLLSDDYKYVPVRRLTLYIEESLYRGTKFAVFEPNDETLWSQLRLSIGTFMADLARQGAFYNYQVVCDKTTTTPNDIARGIVNVIVAFAPVKPAEFIVLQIQQQAAQLSS